MSNPPQSPPDWSAPPPAPPASPARRRIGFWTVLRVVVFVFGLLSLAYWGYISWPYPLPAIPFMIGAPVFAALVWFLFRSPRSPLGTDAVGKVIVEVALVVAASGSWLSIGHPWIGLVFLVVAAVSGIVTFRREAAASDG
jgi:hypothetical protein